MECKLCGACNLQLLAREKASLTAYNEMSVGKKTLSLHQSAGMSRVKHIKNPIGVDTYWTILYKKQTERKKDEND